MTAALPKRPYSGTVDRLHADTEYALHQASTDTEAVEAYSPVRAADWDGTAPTTITEALDRIAHAYAITAGHGAVPELP